MENEQTRREFEDWFNARTNNNDGVAYYVEITGEYCYEDIQLLWEAWKEREGDMGDMELIFTGDGYVLL